MQITYRSFKFLKSRNFLLILLFLLWIVGAIFGTVIFHFSKPSFVALMRSASACTVSIVGLLILVVIPFLISTIAVFCSCPFLIYLLCAISALSYSVCSLAIYASFGAAGWLAQLFLMFSENFSMVSLWVLWLHSIYNGFHVKPSILGVCFSAAAIAGIIDLFVVSPFAVSVFIF